MGEDDQAVFEAADGASEAMPEGPGRTLVWLLDSADLRRRLESAGLSIEGDDRTVRISLEGLRSALERLLRREDADGMEEEEEERIHELLWVVRRAHEEGGRTHLALPSTRSAATRLEVVRPEVQGENLAQRLRLMETGGSLELLQEAERCWPVEDVDLDRLLEQLVPLLADLECGPSAARLLGLAGRQEALVPLDRALLRAPNQEHRLALITALVLLGDRARSLRTLRSMLAHGATETHGATVDVLVRLVRAEDCDILFGTAQLVGPSDRIVLASLMYRLGDMRGYELVEQATSELVPPVDQPQIVRVLEALRETNSTRFLPMAREIARMETRPWCRALAQRVNSQLACATAEPSPEDLLEQAEMSANQGQTELALELIDDLLALKPNHHHALYIQAFLYKELDRLDDALRITQRALEIEPNNWRLQRLTGSLHWDIGSGHASLRAYDRAISQQPTDPYSWYYKGYVLYRMKRYKESLPCLERALSLRPDSTFILNQKGFCLERMGLHLEAATCYRQALRQQPQELRTQEYLGQALQAAGELEEALRVFDNICRASPFRESALFRRADVLFELEAWSQAVEAYQRYLGHHEGSFRAWFNCGLCHRRCDNPLEAADCFRRALRLRPESRSARTELERCLRLLSP